MIADHFVLPLYYGSAGAIPRGAYWLVELVLQDAVMYWCDVITDENKSHWSADANDAAVFDTRDNAIRAASARVPNYQTYRRDLEFREHIWE